MMECKVVSPKVKLKNNQKVPPISASSLPPSTLGSIEVLHHHHQPTGTHPPHLGLLAHPAAAAQDLSHAHLRAHVQQRRERGARRLRACCKLGADGFARLGLRHLELGLHSPPGVRLVTWTIRTRCRHLYVLTIRPTREGLSLPGVRVVAWTVHGVS
jgi:hypothetical protein